MFIRFVKYLSFLKQCLELKNIECSVILHALRNLQEKRISIRFNTRHQQSRPQPPTSSSFKRRWCLRHACIRPSVEEIAEVHGTFARCCLWAWQIFRRRVYPCVYFVSRPGRIETSFFPRGTRACNFLESLRISSHSPMSANRAGRWNPINK